MFQGEGYECGLLWCTTGFIIKSPLYCEGRKWRIIVVDGVCVISYTTGLLSLLLLVRNLCKESTEMNKCPVCWGHVFAFINGFLLNFIPAIILSIKETDCEDQNSLQLTYGVDLQLCCIVVFLIVGCQMCIEKWFLPTSRNRKEENNFKLNNVYDEPNPIDVRTEETTPSGGTAESPKCKTCVRNDTLTNCLFPDDGSSPKGADVNNLSDIHLICDQNNKLSHPSSESSVVAPSLD